MPHRTIETEDDRASFAKLLGHLSLPVTIEWTPGRDRTRDQNALQWLWATEAAKQYGDRSAAEVQREWKLRHGVPILREDSAEFRATYDRHVKPLPYHAKIDFMDLIDVSSAMKVRQMVRYLDSIQRECLQNGLTLTDPDPALSSYQSRYREKAA